MNETELFKGRKGKKKREAIENEIVKLSEEFENRYLHTREMKYIEQNVTWMITSRLVFLMGQRLVYFRYKGLRDYGFIRLCANWFERTGIDNPNPEQVVNMMMEILPEELRDKLSEELKTIDFV